MTFVLPEERFHPQDPIRGEVPHAYTPNVPLRLISDAAWELGAAPDTDLEIDPDYEPEIIGAAGEMMLRDIIQQSQQPYVGTSAPHFSAMPGGLESCSVAEPRMLMAIRHLHYQVGSTFFGLDQAVRIVNDEAGQPLLIQKNASAKPGRGVNLGMSLQDLQIGKVVWPAGTLLQVRSPHRIENDEPVSVISADQVRALGPLRLSAFALPPEERQPFIEMSSYDAFLADVIGNISMDEIRDSVFALTK